MRQGGMLFNGASAGAMLAWQLSAGGVATTT